MKPLKNKITKNLIIILIITTILSGFAPNYVQAETSTGNGGGILYPIEQFVVFICDNVMQWLQETFISTDGIKEENGEYMYDFRYSPAIIFSGEVPAFDINFISPKNLQGAYNRIGEWLQEPKQKAEISRDAVYIPAYQYYEFQEDMREVLEQYKRVSGPFLDSEYFFSGTDKIDVEICYKIEGDYVYVFYVERHLEEPAEIPRYEVYYKETILEITEELLTKLDSRALYGSTALRLQGTIASWYNALRRIALVGLLSVLVYVGIRIVLTSSSQDKAKYKNMLKDWLVAICLLFTLHYIMNATLVVVDEISDIFSTGETDELLNSLRTEIDTGEWGEVLAKVIMYTVIVIFTITFTIQYIMRVIYMAFFTLIAPLITLTYPLDKIKDGQAQAFSMWIKEYIFTALVQVIHLVIYYVLVSSALALVKDYPLFAIIVMAFIKKAEGLLKKMFGFEKSETVGTLGAAATGGLVMNAINSLKGAGGKGGKSGGGNSGSNSGGSSGNVRTATNNPLIPTAGGKGGSAGGAMPIAAGSARPVAGTPTSASTPSQISASGSGNSRPKRNIAGGVKSLAGKAFKPVAGAALGALTGGAGAMIGLAAGIAQGDIGAAFTGALAGGAAGRSLGQAAVSLPENITKGVRSGISNIKDTYREGAYGKEAAQAIKFDEEFRGGSTYKALQNNANFSEESVQEMLNAGITDKKAMTAILDSRMDINDAIKYHTIAQNCPNEIYYNDNMLRTFWKRTMGTEEKDAEKIRDMIGQFK